MNIKEYAEISKNVEIPDLVKERFESTIKNIQSKNIKQAKERNRYAKIVRFASIAAAIIIVFSTVTLSVRAYIKHLDAIKNMSGEEVISLYENVYKYDRGRLSRGLSEEEDPRIGELFLAYSNDTAEPESEVDIIDKKEQYKGKGVAFCKEDGILYIPEDSLSDEEILEIIEFWLIGNYISTEGYELATNPDHYMNSFKELPDSKIDEIYVSLMRAGTETNHYSRDLNDEEKARRKALKKLYMYTDKKPAKEIDVISDQEEYDGKGVAFCTYDGTFHLPEDEMSDEDILEIIDYVLKQEYAIRRINEDIESGKRTEWPHFEVVKKERVETLNNVILSEEEALSSDWLKAYAKVCEDYFEYQKSICEEHGESVEEYYVAVSFIYLNDDEIPEMLFTRNYISGYSGNDAGSRCVFLYTYKDGEAKHLEAEFGEGIGYYAKWSPFRYVERKGMVLDDGHYTYAIQFEEYGNGNHDDISDNIFRMDYWDLDTLTCTHSDMNIKLEHAVYNWENNETYDDSEKTYEYYLGVKEITRDEYTGVTDPLKGKKVSESEFNAANEALWNGEEYKTVTGSDFDRIYCDYDFLESLAKCYQKMLNCN